MASASSDTISAPCPPASPPTPFPQIPEPTYPVQEAQPEHPATSEMKKERKTGDPAAAVAKHQRQNQQDHPKRTKHLRHAADREFAYGLVYHEAISRGATISQARRAVEAEHLTHARAKQLSAVRALPHRRWDYTFEHDTLSDQGHSYKSQRRRPHDSNRSRTRKALRRLGRSSPRGSDLSWEDEPPPRPVPLPYETQWPYPPRGRSKVRTPSGSPARDREPNRRHLHGYPQEEQQRRSQLQAQEVQQARLPKAVSEPVIVVDERQEPPTSQAPFKATPKTKSPYMMTPAARPRPSQRMLRLMKPTSPNAQDDCVRRVSPREAEEKIVKVQDRRLRRERCKKRLHEALCGVKELPVRRGGKVRRWRRWSVDAQKGSQNGRSSKRA